jgi:hypothetical protein
MSYQSLKSPNWDSFKTVSRLPRGREGGGFPRVQAVVSQVSPELLVACPSTKGVLEYELTNLLIGLMQV